MAFDFEQFNLEKLEKLGPAAFIVKAIVAAVVADVVLLAFILLRRGYRRWYFADRDARVIQIRQQWDRLLRGEIGFETWRNNRRDCQIVESMALDAFESADRIEAAHILRFLRSSGLITKFSFEARRHRGWRRREALVALGRTRAPEAISTLTEALRDRDLETRLAALHGLERMSCPEAGEGILDWVSEAGLTVPAHPVRSALILCCAERPQILMSHLQNSQGEVRELLARVLGEVATPSLKADLLQFVDDEVPELRAAAARALSHGDSNLAIDALGQLSQDSVWFVRLRAMVSLGQLHSTRPVDILLRGITDSKRLVRVRAAEALLNSDPDQAAIFEKVIATQDRYAIDAYLSALDNAGLIGTVEQKINALDPSRRNSLLEVLRTKMVRVEPTSPHSSALAKAASTS